MVAEKELAAFPVPLIHVNESGWGPTTLPTQYVGIPFSPFSKNERVGKAADFLGRDGRSLKIREEESMDVEKFNLVDTLKPRSTRTSFRGRWNRRRNLPARRNEGQKKPQLKGKQLKYLVQHTRRGKQWRRPRDSGRPNYRRHNRQKEASVKIQAEWEVMEQFDLSALTKMQIQPPKAEDLKVLGSLCQYNEVYDKITTRTGRPLDKNSFRGDVYPSHTTSDDPVLVDYAREFSSTGAEAAVFCTDELMAQLMVSTRSIVPWDVTFTRLNNNMVFLDKRDDAKLHLDTVNETAPPVSEEEEKNLAPYNKKEELSVEATRVNALFRQQTQKSSKKKLLSKENPLLEVESDDEDHEAQARAAARKNLSIAYRYRKFALGSIDIYCRTELHAICKQSGKKAFATVFAFNEWDHKLAQSVDWRRHIDNQRGLIIATELKNNAYKLGKWTTRTLLAGAETMRLGFVSRKSKTDPTNHVVLGAQSFDPTSLAVQINLSQKNMWGIFKAIIDIVLKQEVGKYFLLKDPNRQVLRLYRLPLEMEAGGEMGEEETDEDDDSQR